MPSPFLGMDPYLEHPALGPDVHNRVLAALADTLAPEVAPRYYVALERRTYAIKPDDLVLIGRPDIAVVQRQEAGTPRAQVVTGATAVLEVDVPMADEVEEVFLEVRDVATWPVRDRARAVVAREQAHGPGPRPLPREADGGPAHADKLRRGGSATCRRADA